VTATPYRGLRRRRGVARIVLFIVCFCGTLTAQVAAPENAEPRRVSYSIELKDPAQHLVHVSVTVPPGGSQRDLQLPLWNATYQVRDFAQYVTHVSAHNAKGPVAIRQMASSAWRIWGAENGATFEYDETLDLPGPFGAQFNEHHAFLNLAMVLAYPVGGRDSPISLAIRGVSADWKMATPLPSVSVPKASLHEMAEFPDPKLQGVIVGGGTLVQAAAYDRLVDSPIELGKFQAVAFEQDGAKYSIVIDADPADYDLVAITNTLRKITAAEVVWMNNRPYDHYTFLYHFPRGPADDGMEHAYSTAIDVSADRVRQNPDAIASVSAHEFFHLWNVKRIRPQSLEPVDYTREQSTRALWWSEGVTSTVADLILVRAGLSDEPRYLRSVAREISNLQSRPAHAWQSVEESSLSAWLEKYPSYSSPERSISYYNKGYIVGMLLDLAVLDATGGRKSLRDVFYYLNENYAKRGRFFDDSSGIREAVEAVAGRSFRDFFEKYVAGVEEMPYDDYFKSVGLRVERAKATVGDPGFTVARSFGQPAQSPVVTNVRPDGPAARAGVQPGDIIVAVDERPVTGDLAAQLSALKPGDTVKLKVTRRGQARDIALKLGAREREDYSLVDLPQVTPEQRARRAQWIGTPAAKAAP